MTNHPNRSKQQQPKHTPSAFPELTREGLEELCLRQNQHVAELLAALKAMVFDTPKGADVRYVKTVDRARAAIAKAEGR